MFSKTYLTKGSHLNYGDEYLELLEKEYKTHPELVLINPQSLDIVKYNFTVLIIDDDSPTQ